MNLKKHRIHGVHKTLVNGLLDSFSTSAAKQKIRDEFIRMGLKYSSGVFSLNGAPVMESIKTNKACYIYLVESDTKALLIPPNTIIGNLVERLGTWTLFRPIGAKTILKIKSSNIY